VFTVVEKREYQFNFLRLSNISELFDNKETNSKGKLFKDKLEGLGNVQFKIFLFNFPVQFF
jgi:hypothetical protein